MNAMALSLLVPLSAAVGYAMFGWRPATRHLAAAAGTLLLAGALLAWAVGFNPHQAIFVAALAGVALAVGIMLPRNVADEMTDRKIGAKAARWVAALTMGVVTLLVVAVTMTDLGLSWLSLAAVFPVVGMLMTYQRQPTGTASAFGLMRAVAAPVSTGLVTVVALWVFGGSGWVMVPLGVVLIAFTVHAPVGLARLGVMSHLPPAGAIVVFTGVPIAAIAVVLRWSGQAAIALSVSGVRSMLVVAGMLTLAAAVAAMLWSRDLRSLLGYLAATGGGFALLLSSAGPEAAELVAVFVGTFGIVVTSLIVATADVIGVIGSSNMRLVAGWWERSRRHAGVMVVALAASAGIPAVALWFSRLGQWGVLPPAMVAVSAMACAVVVTGRRLVQPGPHPHLAVADSGGSGGQLTGLPVTTACVVLAVLVAVVAIPWLG